MSPAKAPAYHATMCASALVAALAMLVVHARAADVSLPAGTVFQIRLTTSVSSQTSHPGDPVSAVIIAPIDLGLPGRGLAAGSRLVGVVSQVSPHRLDRQASLTLNFNTLDTGAGTTTI